jgi:hypothetical protein
VGQKEGTFKLNPPMLTTTVHQGETKDVAIGIDRGTNFDGDVTLNFSQEPKGVTVDAPNPVIKAGDKEVKAMVKAAPDAAVGDFTIKVTGHPAAGPDAVGEFRIAVDKK